MADALLSPAVGAASWLASASLIGWSARRVARQRDEQRIPLMGVMGAFVFAAQMVNFAIPGTGSSGHLGGGLLLAIVLGPEAALVAMASVLTLQALLFADGGLLALGCNLLNLGLFPCWIAYPLVFRPLAGPKPGRRRLVLATLTAAVVGLQLGAGGVVLETWASGVTALPLGTFALLMQPIHLAIGVVEGLATAAVVLFVLQARPELLAARRRLPGPDESPPGRAGDERSPASRPGAGRRLLTSLGLATAALAAIVTWFASARPDGLEWALERAAPGAPITPLGRIHRTLAEVQRRTALLPDYSLPAGAEAARPASAQGPTEPWPAVAPATSLAGLVGSALTLGLAFGAGALLAKRRRKPS